MNIKRNTAVIVAAATVGALGIGGVVAANADNSAPSNHVTTHNDKGDGDGEVPDSQEGADGRGGDEDGGVALDLHNFSLVVLRDS